MANAKELLDTAIMAHGGMEKWNSISEITARIRTGGLLFRAKFVSSLLNRFEIKVSTNKSHAIITPFPSKGYKGIFDADGVYIETDAGERIYERSEARSCFRSFRHNVWWDYLDVLYFVGYASFNYICTPFLFLLPGFQINEIEPWIESDEVWRRLAVTFPEDVPTHSREQVFYFDSQGLLRRLDYTAEVVATWANAAHYCWEHRNFSGLVVPTKRKVFPRKSDNKVRSYPVMVSIEIGDIEIG